MRVLDLFSGIGGFSLAAHWAGMQTAAFCEIEPFCQKVLKKNFPGVPIYDDVRAITKEQLEKDGVIDGDRAAGAGIDLVTGGYPCQGESLAGKRRGNADERWLWPEMYRIIRELRPAWVLGENVAGHISLGLDEVLSDLEEAGYKTRVFVFPAVSIGAPHKRERTFIIGYAGHEPKPQANKTTGTVRSEWETRQTVTWKPGGDVPGTYWEENKPPVCGVDDGLSSRLDQDRLKSLGNAVVPQQVYLILKAIMEVEQHGNVSEAGT
jgi:DNA (cytosine-5)-methyltransferase 1